MKYLLFNLLVVVALAFLLFDGEPPKTVRGAVNKVAVEADRLVAKGKDLIRSANTESPARRTSPVTTMPQPVTTAQAGGSRDASVAVPPDVTDTVSKPVTAAVDQVAVEADRLVANDRDLIGPAKTKSPARRIFPVTPMPQPVTTTQAGGSRDASVAVPPDIGNRATEPVTKPAVAASTPGTVSPQPAKPRKVNNVPIRVLDSTVAIRRAEVLGEVPNGAVGAPAATAEFMASHVRRSELHKLAEDMELMFVEKAGR
jgi:hypothetical protein